MAPRLKQLLEELIRLAPDHRQGLVLLARGANRLAEWTQAAATINLIKEKGLPEHHYLTGFLLWKKREFSKAVIEFRAAISLGQNSMEVYHGLACCLVRLDRLAEAEKVIEHGLYRRRPNNLLLDLAAQVAISQGKFGDAEKYTDQLKRIQAIADYNFRMATLYSARKQFALALPLAEEAMLGTRDRFEVAATLIDTLIELRDFKRAASLLDDLDQRQRHGRD